MDIEKEDHTEKVSDQENEIFPETSTKPQEDDVHTLKCKPATSITSTTDGCALSCLDEAEKEQVEPFIVMIKISTDDLDSILRKNVKIVVKDYVLKDLRQPTELKSPK